MKHIKVEIPPYDPNAVLYGYTNTHVQGPNPAPGLTTAYRPNPFRLHSPLVNPQGETQDGGVSGVQRAPIVRPSYQGQAPVARMHATIYQAFVPADGVAQRPRWEAEPVQLSQPIRYDMRASLDTPIRQSIVGKAPKAVAHNG